MDQRQVVRMLAVLRVGVGVVAVVAPRRATGFLFGRSSTGPALDLVTRAFGARDVVLGLGTLRALERDVDAEGWARSSAAADAGDVVAALLAFRHAPSVKLLLGASSAATAATLGHRASSRLG